MNYPKKTTLNLILILLVFFSFSGYTQTRPTFNLSQGPTLLVNGAADEQIGAKYIFENIEISADGMLIDAIATIVDKVNLDEPNANSFIVDSALGVDDRFEPTINTGAGDGYVEWKIEFVLAGSVTDATDAGVLARLDEFTIEAIDVDGFEYFEIVVTDSYTLEGPGATIPTDLVVSQNGVWTRFQSDADFAAGIDVANTQFNVSSTYRNISSVSFRNGSSNDSSNRQNSISFLGEITFEDENIVIVNNPPVVIDNLGNVIQLNTSFSANLLIGSSDPDDPNTDLDIDPATVLLIDPNNPANQGSVGSPLVISGVGTYTVGNTGDVVFTPVTSYSGDASIRFSVEDDLGVFSNQANLGIIINDVPLADTDTANVNQDSSANAIDVLDGDTFGSDGPNNGTITLPSPTSTNGGTVTVDDNGTPSDPSDDEVLYTPALGFAGTDTFNYTITDSNGDPSTATVTITVNPNPCDATTSGNLDTDNDGITDICDLDDDNDGILDTNEGCVLSKTLDNVNFSINKSSFATPLNSGINGFGVDILRLDNSFNITVNGASLFSQELNFAPIFNVNPFTVKFADGTQHGTNMPQIWQMGTANAATPLIRLIVAPDGSVEIFGSKTLNGPLEPMIFINGTTVNPILWNATTNNISIDQYINGQTYATGSVYGYITECQDTDGDGISNSLDLDADNDGIYDVVEAGGTDANNDGVADGTPNATTGIPSSAGTGITPIETTLGTPDFLNLDSDGDGCSDANEAYNLITADGVDGGQYGLGTPAANNLNGTVIAAAYNTGNTQVAAVTDGDFLVSVCNPLGSIGDLVWYDKDQDGIRDAGENRLEGATVTLDPDTPLDTSDDQVTFTDANGAYLFANLLAGTYTVTVDVSTIVASSLPSGKTIGSLIPIFDADGVTTPNTSTLTLAIGENNLDQDFAYLDPTSTTGGGGGGTGVGTGNNGGIESESLGDALSKVYVGRKKNSVPTEFVKNASNIYNKSKMKSVQPYQGKGQSLLDMFPTELVSGNVANVTSPTDILDYTIADEVLAVDFSLNGETKGVVLGIKTTDKIYNHTKASCDRLRGAEILNIQKVQIGGYNFLMQGIKQRNGVVEYAVSFATAKNNNDAKYTIQTNWYVNDYTKFNDVYNFQVWTARPADTQKLVEDVLKNLQSFIPVAQVEAQKFPETYASKIYREKGELIVALRSTEVGNTAEVSMVELYSETANNIKHRNNAVSTEIQQSLRLDIADGYEYDGLVKVDGQVSDAFYHADGNWGLDYDKRYTEINNYFVWNDFDRAYQDDEYTINRNVEVKATSDYDYLTVYKSLLPGTLSADYSEYKYLSFTAKGSGLMELGLIKSSIEDWKQQYRVMVDLSEEETTYYVPFDYFSSTGSLAKMTAEDLTTLAFTFLPVEAQTTDLDLFISDVKFTKTAVEDQIVNKIEKFNNAFMAYPNPSKGNVNLLLFSETAEEATVTLSDITGKIIYRGKTQLTAGKNELEFDFKVKTGVMLLQVNSNETDYGTSKIIFR